jgi:hypothetical protein
MPGSAICAANARGSSTATTKSTMLPTTCGRGSSFPRSTSV